MSVVERVRPSREVLAQASVWLARLRADDCTSDDRRGFTAWLAEGDAHQSAFELITGIFETAGAADDSWPRHAAQDTDEEARAPASRRGFLIGAGAVAVGAGAVGWQAAFAGTVETGFGERRHLRLTDGTAVLMDSETRIREPWLRARRLDLEHGRISLQAPASSTEFSVSSAGHRIRGDSIDADIGFERGQLAVSVVRGELFVESGDRAPIRLVAGQRLLPSGMIDQPAMAALTAWRQGQLMFVDAPLAEACAELNRYDRTRLVPAPDVAGLRISGTYRMGRNDQFAQALEQLLPLRARTVNGTVLLTHSETDRQARMR